MIYTEARSQRIICNSDEVNGKNKVILQSYYFVAFTEKLKKGSFSPVPLVKVYVSVMKLPAGHSVQSTAAAGCCGSAGEKRWRADLPASSDRPGDFQLPGVCSCAGRHSRSDLSFSQRSSFPHMPTSHGGTELKTAIIIILTNAGRFHLACSQVNANVHNTCFHANAECLLHGQIKVFKEHRHNNLCLEACARLETFHCVLRLCLWWVDVEDVSDMCMSVV